jgi:hypothetical protein
LWSANITGAAANKQIAIAFACMVVLHYLDAHVFNHSEQLTVSVRHHVLRTRRMHGFMTRLPQNFVVVWE